MYRSYFNLTYYSKILLTDLDSKTVIVPIPWALLRQQDFLNPVLFSMTLIFKKKPPEVNFHPDMNLPTVSTKQY